MSCWIFYLLHSSQILEDFSYWHIFTSRVENSLDPDQLDLHCFQNRTYPELSMVGLTMEQGFI